MKKLIFTTAFVFLIVLNVKPAGFNNVWASDNWAAICCDASNNLYTTGTIPLIKFNQLGVEQSRINNTGPGNIRGTAMVIDASNNVYLCGNISGNVTLGSKLSTSKGQSDAFAAKIDPQGNVLWIVSGGSSTGYESATSITVDQSGNVYITGTYMDSAKFGSVALTGKGGNNIFVVKYDDKGSLQWAQKAEGESASTDFLAPKSIACDHTGNCYVSGSFNGKADFYSTKLTAPGFQKDGFVACFNSGTSVAWVKQVSNGEVDALKIDPTDNIFVSGVFTGATNIGKLHLIAPGGNMASDIFIAKYDRDANVQWANAYGGTYYDVVSAMVLDANENIYLTGDFSDTAFFGNSHVVSNGELDVFAAKYDSNGNKLWVLGAGADGEDGATSICLNKEENMVFILGSIENGPVKFGSHSFSGTNFIASIGDITTGIDLTENKINFKVYPNPSNGNFNISFSQGFKGGCDFKIIDMLGNEVMHKILTTGNQSISVENITKGIYEMVLVSDNELYKQKIIVK